MTYSVTTENLPDFLQELSFMIKLNGKVEYDIKTEINDSQLVGNRRKEQKSPRESVWSEIEQHPNRFSSLVS